MSAHDAAAGRARVEAACAQLRLGRGIVVLDDGDRENEGDLVFAAQHMTPESMAFVVRHTSGLVCVGMEGGRLDELGLPLMVEAADDPRGTAFTLSVDLTGATTTGISAADRAATVRALANPFVGRDQFTRPGHVFPLRARPGGVLQRAGHTEAAVDLCRLAGLQPAGVLAEVSNDDGTMARLPDLVPFAQRHGLPMVSVADIVRYRMGRESLVSCTASARVSTAYGVFTALTYLSAVDGLEHVALVCGDPAGRPDVLVRVHSECLNGDVFGATGCDCGEQLHRAMTEVSRAGQGAIVYLRGHARHKVRAHQLQDEDGLDAVDAGPALGLPVDSREYGVGAQILRDLGISSIRLMTDNPATFTGLSDYGITITERVPLCGARNAQNAGHLQTTAARLDHQLSAEPAPERSAS